MDQPRSPRRAWLVPASLILPAVGAGWAVTLFEARVSAGTIGGLLAATAILTGFTFALALQAWKSALDARRDTRYAFDPSALTLLDQMTTGLLWAAALGVVTTAWLGGLQVWGGDAPWGWALAVGVGLFSYSVMLVLQALVMLYQASIRLR